MTDASALLIALPTILVVAALLVIGALLGRRTGAGRGLIWAGLCVLIGTQCALQVYAFTAPLLVAELGVGFEAVAAVVNILGGALLVTGVALLVLGAVRARESAPGIGYGVGGHGGAPGSPPTSADRPAGNPYLDR